MKKKVIITVTAFIILLFIIMYIFVPPLNLFVKDGAMFLAFIFIAVGVIIFVFQAGNLINSVVGFRNVRIAENKKKYMIPLIFVGIPIIFYIIMTIVPLPLWASSAYKNQLGEPIEKVYNDDINLLDINEIPVVDKALAEKLADRKLGEKTSLGSQVRLGEPTMQKYKGKLVWVVPLEHSGFFKWLSNLDGTPGYIVISATDQRDVEFVEGHYIKYQFGAYFNQDLLRKARFSGSLIDGMIDYSFEIDESGDPYWVITTYKNELGFSLPEATGAILVNAETGETHKYKINEVPEWVDRIQPEEVLLSQINNRGEYINGVFNFSNKDKFRISEGNSVIYNNGKCYLFTGLTSVGSDESAIGFMMIDMRTKETFLYKMSGATEYAASKSAEGKVQNLGYKSTFPLITNINSIPTYFMALKDKEGLIKQYAFVSIDDYTTVGNGETKEVALENYMNLIKSNGKTPENAVELELTGKVLRIGNERQNDKLVYKLVLENQKDKIYTIDSDISQYLCLTKEGDSVKISYIETESDIIPAFKFENVSI